MNEGLVYRGDNSGSAGTGGNLHEADKAGAAPVTGQDNPYLRLFVFALFFFFTVPRVSAT